MTLKWANANQNKFKRGRTHVLTYKLRKDIDSACVHHSVVHVDIRQAHSQAIRRHKQEKPIQTISNIGHF